MSIFRWVFVSVVVIAVVGFALQNQQQMVNVRLGTYTTPETPLFISLFVSFIAGMLLYFLLSVAAQLRLRGELARFRRECNRLKEELNRLRNLNIDKEVEELLKARTLKVPLTIAEVKTIRHDEELEGWGA